jgi:alginate O-acetyltransferase complex protein AlgI
MPQHSLWFLAFVAGAVAILWLLPARFRQAFILVASVVFLGIVDPRAAVLLPATGLLVWLLPGRARWLPVAVTLPFAVLLALRALEGELGDLVVPVGMAFAALRLSHYAVERCHGRLPAHSLLSLLSWLLYFPSVTIGPLQRFDDWLRWERRMRFDDESMSVGFRRVIHGYAKVLILGFWVVGIWLKGWLALSALPVPLQVGIAQCLWLWACFAGYTDIAIGVGRMLGQRLPENFNWPLLQPNLGAFWRSWHASVSSWVRDYAFYPIKAATRSTLLASVGAFLVLGFWHELTVQYLMWALYHASGVAIWQAWRRWEGKPVLPGPAWVGRGLSTALTASFVMLSFALPEVDIGDLVALGVRLRGVSP